MSCSNFWLALRWIRTEMMQLFHDNYRYNLSLWMLNVKLANARRILGKVVFDEAYYEAKQAFYDTYDESGDC